MTTNNGRKGPHGLRNTPLLILTAALLIVGCTEESSAPRAATGVADSPALTVVRFARKGVLDVRRDEPLVVVFSEDLDPESVVPGSIRILRRRGNREQPFEATVKGRRLILTPPSPFGFEAGERYWVIIEGFPSLRAPRSRDGQLMRRRYRASFGTSRLYRPETVPPEVAGVSLREEAGGGWRVNLEFTEPVAPGSMDVGSTVSIRDLSTGQPIPGRLIADRRSRLFRFLPQPGSRPTSVAVGLSGAIQDLAGNPLALRGDGEWILDLPVMPEPRAADNPGSIGEIAEDFTSILMMDPAGTCALWNDPAHPGVLLGSPARTTLALPGDGTQPEEWIGIGDERVELRLILTREELGPARELTGLLWSPPDSGRTRATYRGISVRITPTSRRRLRDTAPDFGPTATVLAEPEYRVEPGRESLVPIPFGRPYRYDGQSNLLVTVVVEPGDHTNFLRVRRTRAGESLIRVGRRAEPLRPALAVRGFSLNPVATSWFFDTGSESPEYLQVFVHPERMPRGMEMEVTFQGARRLGPDGRTPLPDPTAVSEWVKDPAGLVGYRYLRFRVVFRGVSLTGEDPVLDDIVIPFRR